MTSKAFELARLGNAYSDGALSNRNLIINGAMQVAQRGTSATGITGSGFHAVDRFATNGNNGTWTVSHDTDAPDGFSNSFKMLLTATEAVGSNSYMAIQQKIEGQNLQGLAYGTSSAKTVTVSFYVKSNVTGTYCFNLYQDDGTKNYPQNYTIDSADTWEYKTISFVGDTATSLDNDNASSVRAMFFLVAGTDFNSGSAGSRVAYTNATFAAGQTAVVGGAVNDYFQITGVQLEVGDTATPHEHIPYSDQLARCMRYYEKLDDPMMRGLEITGATARRMGCHFLTKKRATPTVSLSGTLRVYNGTGTKAIVQSNLQSTWANNSSFNFDSNETMSGTTVGRACVSYTATSGTVECSLLIDAEL